MNRGTTTDAIKSAEQIDDISKEAKAVILYSDYGPDYEDHFRMIFRDGSAERNAAARGTRDP